MKKFACFIIGVLLLALGALPFMADAQSAATWIPSSGFLKPFSASYGIRVPSLASAGNCITTDADGDFIAAACSGGSGVTSVAMTVPTGLSVAGSPITTTGTLAVSLTAGYNIPLTASTTQWNTFYITPSNRITAGNHIDWTSNTLDVITTGDWTGTLDGVEGAAFALDTDIGTTIQGYNANTSILGSTIGVAELASADFGDFTCNGSACALDGSFGNVSKVGTPVNNQIGVWTGDGTIEGDAALTFDTTFNTVTIGVEGDDAGFIGPAATTADTTGGGLYLSGGNSLGTAGGGEVNIYGGVGGATGGGGDVRLDAGDGGATSGAGGTVRVFAGSAQAGNSDGGSVIISVGGFSGTGVAGQIYLESTTVEVGNASVSAVVKSSGDQDLILQTGNTTTGNITIADGANGNISLTPNGTGIVAVSTDLSVADSAYAGGWNASVLVPTRNAIYDIIETLGRIAGQVWTGIHDFGGATSLEIVNGASPTVDTLGEIALDTTDNQLLIATSTNARAIPTITKLWSGTVASTSLDYASGGRIPLPAHRDGVVITEVHCFVDGGTSKVINVDTMAGGAQLDSLTCATTLTSDTAQSANFSLSAGALMALEFGATTGAVDYVSFSVFGYIKPE